MQDVRNRTGTGSTRVLSSTTLFPQSIRSASKAQSGRSTSDPESINIGDILENGNHSPAEIRSESIIKGWPLIRFIINTVQPVGVL